MVWLVPLTTAVQPRTKEAEEAQKASCCRAYKAGSAFPILPLLRFQEVKSLGQGYQVWGYLMFLLDLCSPKGPSEPSLTLGWRPERCVLLAEAEMSQ